MNEQYKSEYEVVKVANGFMVRPCRDWNNGRVIDFQREMFVFNTWKAASEWLEKALK